MLSINTTKEESIITHSSEKKQPDKLAPYLFLSLTIILFVFSLTVQNGGFIFIAFCLLIASIVGKITVKYIKNSISIKIKREGISIKQTSNQLKGVKTHVLPTQNIRRLYLARSRDANLMNGKNAIGIYGYEIWAEKSNGQKIRFLGEEEGFFSEKEIEAQAIMEKMEGVLQFNEYVQPRLITRPTRIEQSKILKANIPKRKINKEAEISKMTIKDLKVGVLFDYKNETWEVIAQTQYDWQRGNTDTLYQLQNSQNTTILLLVYQDMAIYTTWLEERLPYHELAKNNLNKVHQGLPLEFEFRDKLFLKESLSSGHEFVGTNQGQSIKEWKYISEDNTETLRILEHEDEDVFAFLGKEIKSYEFSNILLP